VLVTACVCGINIAEHLCARNFHQAFAASDIELSTQLFSLVAIENPQRKTDTGA